MAPPGRPNMTSVPSISTLLMRAWAPVSCIGVPWAWGGHETPLARGEGRRSARARRGGRALGNYDDQLEALHGPTSMPDERAVRQRAWRVAGARGQAWTRNRWSWVASHAPPVVADSVPRNGSPVRSGPGPVNAVTVAAVFVGPTPPRA